MSTDYLRSLASSGRMVGYSTLSQRSVSKRSPTEVDNIHATFKILRFCMAINIQILKKGM